MRLSQSELAVSSAQPSCKPKKSKLRQTQYSKPKSTHLVNADSESLRHSSVPPSPNRQLSMSTFFPDVSLSSDEAEHDIGKTPYMVKPPVGNIKRIINSLINF